MKLIDGKKCSCFLKESIYDTIKSINEKLKLIVIRIGNDESSRIYINTKRKACCEAGIDFEEIVFDEKVEELEVINKIKKLNNDKKVTSILVQLPIPNHLNKNNIINSIDYKKDVDGLTDINKVRLMNNQKCIVPCTAQGIIQLFDFYKINPEGKKITLIGRSELVNKPLLSLLLNKNATITLCHSKTKNLKFHTSNADIIVCAVGKANFLTKNMIKKNSIIIDVGINKVDSKICGDANFEDVKVKVKYITPVPGGVGVMTVTNVLQNVIECYKLNKL
jgi:methylenetetrahydrofolate dehydrogenase (NADP+)/methenyltetrahydrofolate cyclohydrolase